MLGTLQPYFTWATLFFERDTQPSEKSTRLLAKSARLPAQSVCLPAQGASGVVNQVIGPASIHLCLLTGHCAPPTAHLRVQHIHQPGTKAKATHQQQCFIHGFSPFLFTLFFPKAAPKLETY